LKLPNKNEEFLPQCYTSLMEFLTNVIIAIFTAYLSFTNFLAGEIIEFLEPVDDTATIIETSTSSNEEIKIPSLPTDFPYQNIIPNILINNPEYQKASLLDSTEIINATTNDPLVAIVNIYCTYTTSTFVRTTTGTGFFVSPGGVILTNAHVAQFFLLENTDALGNTECIIRSGSPATPKYTAELLYISPAWVQEHAKLINEPSPSGTGERDYALLYVNNTIDGSPLPATFPALKTNTDLLPRSITGTTVTASGYPAESLLTSGFDTDLLPREATSTITELYTFGSNYADIFSITGSKIGEHGSSGGPIVTDYGSVIGMITTKGDDVKDGTGSLRAITLSHINRTITEETGFSFARNVSGNLPYRARIFTETMAPFLRNILEDASKTEL